jgi:hypothetical protein
VNNNGAGALVVTVTYAAGVFGYSEQLDVHDTAAPPAIQLQYREAMTLKPETSAASFVAAVCIPTMLALFPLAPYLAPADAASMISMFSRITKAKLIVAKKINTIRGIVIANSIIALASSSTNKLTRSPQSRRPVKVWESSKTSA